MALDPVTGKEISTATSTTTTAATTTQDSNSQKSASIFNGGYLPSPIIDPEYSSSSLASCTYSYPSAPISQYSNSYTYSNSYCGNSYGTLTNDQLAQLTPQDREIYNLQKQNQIAELKANLQENSIERNKSLPSKAMELETAYYELNKNINNAGFFDRLFGTDLDNIEKTLGSLSEDQKKAVEELYFSRTGKPLKDAIKESKEGSIFCRTLTGGVVGTAAVVGATIGSGIPVVGTIIGGVAGAAAGLVWGLFNSSHEEQIIDSLA